MTRSLFLPLTALAVAACQPAANDGAADVATPAANSVDLEILPPDESTLPIDGAAPADDAVVPSGVPVALIGRWGMVAADCEPGRSDAKGLMTITADRLEFYESRATPGAVAERTETRLVADFAFTGEGQEWSKRMSLDVQDAGQVLIRREQGADAMPGPLRYQKCPA